MLAASLEILSWHRAKPFAVENVPVQLSNFRFGASINMISSLIGIRITRATTLAVITGNHSNFFVIIVIIAIAVILVITLIVPSTLSSFSSLLLRWPGAAHMYTYARRVRICNYEHGWVQSIAHYAADL